MTKFRLAPMDRTDLIAVDPSASPVAPMRPQLTLDTRYAAAAGLDIIYLHQSDDALPTAVYHGFVRRWNIPVTADAERFASAINAGELDSLLTRIIDGSDKVWDGQNHINPLTEDAMRAVEKVGEWVNKWAETLPDGAGLWEAGDWFDLSGVDGVTEETTDAELQTMAARLEKEALAECVVLADTFRYLNKRRDQMR